MAVLIVDIGNSRVKYCYAEQESLSEVVNCAHEKALSFILDSIMKREIEASIVSSTASLEFTAEVVNSLKKHTGVTEVSHELTLPFKMGYETPKTLGLDRIANVCGAIHFHPKNTCLVIDLGTCITYDVIEKGYSYHGGAISPGLQMRFKAMNDYSAKLPRLQDSHGAQFPGKTTEESLRSGVYYGILGEINQFILETEQSFGEVKVHLTGGDYKRFEKGLKSPIFANPKLTLWGLYELLKSNN
ncbi:MAG: type III pantothenate kinase [Flavobacteriales bacterium]